MSVAVARRSFELPLERPLSTARGAIRRREGWLLRVEADGAVGLGEATPLAGWTESRADCEDALAAAADALHEDGLPDVARGSSGSGRSRLPSFDADHPALAATDGAPAARHALTLALLELAARRRDVPLYRLLGSTAVVESVPVNGTVGDGAVAATARAARAERRRGFDCLKVKVGARPPDEDLRRLAAVRAELGGDVALRADANGAWTPAQAREALEAMDEEGIAPEYVEQPLAADDLPGLSALRASSEVPVAVDESLASHTPEEVLVADAADVLVCKPMALGGVDRALAAARTARAAGLEAVVTTTVDGAVARAAAVHAAAAIADPPACGLATADRLASDLGPDPCPVEDGRIAVPQGPGSGPGGTVERWWEDG